nr:hypothetical protein [Equine protoparvovirus]
MDFLLLLDIGCMPCHAFLLQRQTGCLVVRCRGCYLVPGNCIPATSNLACPRTRAQISQLTEFCPTNPLTWRIEVEPDEDGPDHDDDHHEQQEWKVVVVEELSARREPGQVEMAVRSIAESVEASEQHVEEDRSSDEEPQQCRSSSSPEDSHFSASQAFGVCWSPVRLCRPGTKAREPLLCRGLVASIQVRLHPDPSRKGSKKGQPCSEQTDCSRHH